LHLTVNFIYLISCPGLGAQTRVSPLLHLFIHLNVVILCCLALLALSWPGRGCK